VTAGAILSQFGPVFATTGPFDGVGFSVDGMKFDEIVHPSPSTLEYTPPERVGFMVSGNPVYQGPPGLKATWENCEIDTFQALAVIYFGKQNYPLVDLVWPDPQQAGRYISAQAFMGWPRSSYQPNGYLSAEVEFFSLREIGSGYF
jgi:hypothetical protein